MKYYLSLMNPGVDSTVLNELYYNGTSDMSAEEDITTEEESGNTFVPEQQQYSAEVSRCQGICTPEQIAAVTLGVGAIIGIVIGVVVFVVVTAASSKKGYDVYMRRRLLGLPASPENPMYRDSGRTGNNPFYSESQVEMN